jgi:molybdate-binding protein
MNATKLPTDTRPLVRDPDLARELEKELRPYSGEKLERAQDAIRQVRGSGIQGMFDQVLAAYKAAIDKAAAAYDAEQKTAAELAAQKAAKK